MAARPLGDRTGTPSRAGTPGVTAHARRSFQRPSPWAPREPRFDKLRSHQVTKGCEVGLAPRLEMLDGPLTALTHLHRTPQTHALPGRFNFQQVAVADGHGQFISQTLDQCVEGIRRDLHTFPPRQTAARPPAVWSLVVFALRSEVHDKHEPALVRKRRLSLNRSEEHTSELQSLRHLVCRLLLEKKKKQ